MGRETRRERVEALNAIRDRHAAQIAELESQLAAARTVLNDWLRRRDALLGACATAKFDDAVPTATIRHLLKADGEGR